MRGLVLAFACLSGVAAAQIPGVNQPASGAVLGQVSGSVRAIDDSARESARLASDRAARAAAPRVEARAGLRVPRDTRCHDSAGEFDPLRRDGHYYCERRGAAGRAPDRP